MNQNSWGTLLVGFCINLNDLHEEKYKYIIEKIYLMVWIVIW